jgi:hypothetical protein
MDAGREAVADLHALLGARRAAEAEGFLGTLSCDFFAEVRARG